MASHRTAVITNIGDQHHTLVILDDARHIPPEEWARIEREILRLSLRDGHVRVPLARMWYFRDDDQAAGGPLSEAYRQWRKQG